MTKDPWTDPDPQPGDFDEFLAALDPRDVQVVEAGNGAKVTALPGMTDEDAKRLVEIAVERGKSIREVLAELAHNVDEWGDLDKFSARASLGVLRHMTEEEEKAGFSWEEYR
jgi:hypothetical protein